MNRYDLTRSRIYRAAARRKEAANQVAMEAERIRQAEEAIHEHAQAKNLLVFARWKLARLNVFKLTLTNELLTVEDRWSDDRLKIMICFVFSCATVIAGVIGDLWGCYVLAGIGVLIGMLSRPKALRVVIAADDPLVARLTDWHDGAPASESRAYVFRVLQQFEGAAMVQFPSLFDRLVGQVRRVRGCAS